MKMFERIFWLLLGMFLGSGVLVTISLCVVTGEEDQKEDEEVRDNKSISRSDR